MTYARVKGDRWEELVLEEELVFIILVEEFDGVDEVPRDSNVVEDRPHIFVIEAGEGCREVEKEESTLRMCS